MRRNVLAYGLAALVCVVCSTLSAPALAGWGIFARGDYQILTNDSSGVSVVVWVENRDRRGQHALVTFVGKDLKGAPVQASYPVWVPGCSARPVTISFGFPIGPDPKIIVTALGT